MYQYQLNQLNRGLIRQYCNADEDLKTGLCYKK